MKDLNYSFKECAAHKKSTVYLDEENDGIRQLIMRGPCAMVAYLGVPLDSPVANIDYNDMPSIDVHGGLTFSAIGKDGTPWPKGYWWFGWDYGHSGDRAFYDLERDWNYGETEWTPEMVEKEMWSAAYNLNRIIEYSKKIKETK